MSCQALLQGDVVIDVPASSQVHHQVVRKPHEAHDIRLIPLCTRILSKLPNRICTRRWATWSACNAHCGAVGPAGLVCELSCRANCSGAESGQSPGDCCGSQRRTHRRGLAGPQEQAVRYCVDVGSTTIAAHLCDLASGEVLASAGMMNPQIRYGEDLMSRVSYIMMNEGGEAKLIRSVRKAINELVGEVAAQAELEPRDVMEMTVVGNPIMQHLVLGLNPVELGTAPFALATDSSVDVLARSIDIDINPGGHVYALPCIAGHVGADAAGVLLAEAPYERDEVSLVVDVGTNAEISARQYKSACWRRRARPGRRSRARKSAGQRAAPGAIERVRIDKETLEPKFKVIGCDLWSNDPEFEEQTKASGVTGICGSGIIEVVAEMFLAGVLDPDGKIKQHESISSPRVIEDGRTFAYVLHAGQQDICDYAKRRSGDPTRESRVACRRQLADGALRRRERSIAYDWPVLSARTSTSSTR